MGRAWRYRAWAWWVGVAVVPTLTAGAAAWAVYRDLHEVLDRPCSSTTWRGTGKVWRTAGGFSGFGDSAVSRWPEYLLRNSVRTLNYFARGGHLVRVDTAIGFDSVAALDERGNAIRDLPRDEAAVIVLKVLHDENSRGYDANVPPAEVPPEFREGTQYIWPSVRLLVWRAAAGPLEWGVWAEAVALGAYIAARVRTRRDPTRCPGCSYPRVPGAPRCPECGRVYGAHAHPGPSQTP